MRSWRVLFIFLGVFCAGAVAGGFISLRLVKHAGERRMPEDLAFRMMERFSHRLELTEEQRARIRPHVERAAAEMERFRQQTAEIIEELHHVVSRDLTPAQREIFEAMRNEQRERWKKWMEKREQERRQHRQEGEGGADRSREPGATTPPAPAAPAGGGA